MTDIDTDNRTTYIGLLRMSCDYLRAFNILHSDNNKITHLFSVKFYLLAHSIELSLKAYLRFKKHTLNELKELGHDLIGIYSELSSKYLYRLDARSFSNINAINSYYKNKEFEYPVTGTKNVVELDDLMIIAEMINKSTEIQIATESTTIK